MVLYLISVNIVKKLCIVHTVRSTFNSGVVYPTKANILGDLHLHFTEIQDILPKVIYPDVCVLNTQ